jgi:hypothetical protein
METEGGEELPQYILKLNQGWGGYNEYSCSQTRKINFNQSFWRGGDDGPCAGRVCGMIDEGFARTSRGSKVHVLRRKSGREPKSHDVIVSVCWKENLLVRLGARLLGGCAAAKCSLIKL